MNRFATFIIAVFACCNFALAEIKLPNIFTDHLVLQRDAVQPMWGTASPGRTVTISFADKTVTATTDIAGRWKAFLPAMRADSSPKYLTVTGDGQPVTLHDVVVGDVWFCAGQSNMEFALFRANGGAEAIEASDDPLLREFDVAVDGNPQPQADVKGSWKPASPQTAGNFSAVAYFFAEKLRHDVKVPIGIVHSSVRGTRIEAWSRRKSLDGIGLMKKPLKAADVKLAAATQPYSEATKIHMPGWLYNSGVAPLVGMGIRGFVWYQGESNVDNANDYKTLFPKMISDWRAQWLDAGEPAATQPTTKPRGKAPPMPFLFVQIAAREASDEPYGSPTADLRLAQASALDTQNTMMAIAIDTRAVDWHPLDKKPVGDRLAAQALRFVYGQERVAVSGPVWISKSFGPDGTAVVSFINADQLFSIDGPPTGFALAGDDRRFVPAQAKIIKDTVELRAPGVDHPVAIRYAWTRGPHCNLYNAAGLPPAPFRTDDWPTPTTKPAK